MIIRITKYLKKTSRQRLIVFPVMVGLFFLSPPSLAEGSVKISNCGTDSVYISSYDWDDSVTLVAYSTDTLDEGDDYTFSCVKNLADSDAPGCKLVVNAGTSGGFELADWSVENGNYTIATTNIESEDGCGTTIEACLIEQDSCSSTSAENTTNCTETGSSFSSNESCEEDKLID